MTGGQVEVARIIGTSPAHLAALAAVADLAPPGAAIGAGFIRNLVWDVRAGLDPATPADVDVVFHDPCDLARSHEAAIGDRLASRLPDLPWQVRNQARMHVGRAAAPFRSLDDAIAHWPETATAVAVRLHPGGGIEIIAPHGLDDLLALVVRPVAGLEAVCAARWREKRWGERWPVRLVGGAAA